MNQDVKNILKIILAHTAVLAVVAVAMVLLLT
jgi:hypothetical protein